MSPGPPNVRLRRVREDDLPILFEHQLDPEANRMANFPPRDRDAFMAHWTRILGDASLVAEAIELDGEIVGNVVSWTHDGERDVGYWISRNHWGAGIATAALRVLLSDIDERPLFAYVAEHNIGSIRVLEKCGFRVVERVELPEGEGGGFELRYRLDDASPASATIA
jgi:RimJ/RimL family protein N-acetyltransferase